MSNAKPFLVPIGSIGGKAMWGPLVLKGSPVLVYPDEGRIHWVAGMNIDVDGSGESHGDPYYQPDTTLHLNGKPLNADVDRYIVVPPQIIQYAELNLGVERDPESGKFKESRIVLGCQARANNRVTRQTSDAVVGDIGPKTKIGEASRALALAVGINGDPVRGGESAHIIEYDIWPNKAAVVNGKAYSLQPYA